MSFENIGIGDRIDITIIRSGKAGRTYITQVADILDYDQRVLLAYVPILRGRIVRLDESKDYSVIVYTPRGMFKFDSNLSGYMKEGDMYFIALNLSQRVEKVQRREFFRFSCFMAMKFSVIDPSKHDSTTNVDYSSLHDGIIRDIGGGGLRFISNQDIDEKHQIYCIIMLDNKWMMANGRVLSKQYSPKFNFKYQYRAEFTDITPTEQEEIVNFVFKEQRKQRKIDFASAIVPNLNPDGTMQEEEEEQEPQPQL
ncbi:MAG: PilZ domain-containing protein [Defluviitaleaceae bacterium]|nr:PilZ domain-containing protein [Defluviitaleaceae bacterium]